MCVPSVCASVCVPECVSVRAAPTFVELTVTTTPQQDPYRPTRRILLPTRFNLVHRARPAQLTSYCLKKYFAQNYVHTQASTRKKVHKKYKHTHGRPKLVCDRVRPNTVASHIVFHHCCIPSPHPPPPPRNQVSLVSQCTYINAYMCVRVRR